MKKYAVIKEGYSLVSTRFAQQIIANIHTVGPHNKTWTGNSIRDGGVVLFCPKTCGILFETDDIKELLERYFFEVV